MNKKIIVKPVDDLTEIELRRLESELSTIGGFDFFTSIHRGEICTEDNTQSKAKPDIKKSLPSTSEKIRER